MGTSECEVSADDGPTGLSRPHGSHGPNEKRPPSGWSFQSSACFVQVVDLNKAAITRLGLMLADLRNGSGAAGADSALRTGAS